MTTNYQGERREEKYPNLMITSWLGNYFDSVLSSLLKSTVSEGSITLAKGVGAGKS